jgi:tRNA-binding EMAP/Myf-like protein
VHIGLPYHSDLKTLPVFTENVVASGRARVKNINHAYIRVYKSKGLLCGADEENLVEVKQRTTENYGQSTRLASAEERLMLVPSWNDNGQILIRQKDPLPLTIIDLTLEVVFGD